MQEVYVGDHCDNIGLVLAHLLSGIRRMSLHHLAVMLANPIFPLFDSLLQKYIISHRDQANTVDTFIACVGNPRSLNPGAIRGSVDSLCRDGADTPMLLYMGKAFTRTNAEELSLFIMACQ